jgi:predicted nuclease with TOPRIM domain
MDAPADTKRPWDLKQWLKDYGVLAVLLTLGIPALFYLGVMSERLRGVETAIKEELKPELKALRGEFTLLREQFGEVRTEVRLLREQFAELRVEVKLMRESFAEVRSKLTAVENTVTRIEHRIDELARERPRTP